MISSTPSSRSSTEIAPDKLFGSPIVGKTAFGFEEVAVVYALRAFAGQGTQVSMEHLVVKDVAHYIFRDSWHIESPADDNGVICRVIVAQVSATLPNGPGENADAEPAVKVFLVDSVEKGS